ncbi:MAG: amidase [Chloroflexi bacterium]|nr:amidase [Chloroflexota bacterium]
MTSDPVEMTAAVAADAIRRRRISPGELVEALLERIERLEPRLQAWETVDADGARQAAGGLEAELGSRGPRGALHGVPVGFKDIYYTAGMPTTMSSRVYAGFVPEYDSECVARLRRAGAIVLGKTVTTEFAMGDPSRTRNPWNAAHTPGGSSSGSAVAVAARMCPVATGSQTAGSVNRPAAYNGVVGFKPTCGQVSRYGVFPVSWTLDTLGWMCRCVEDAALVLDAVSGHDPRDPASANLPPSEAAAAVRVPMEAPSIGVAGGFFDRNSSADVRAHTGSVAEELRSAGARVEAFTLPGSFRGIHEAQLAIDYSECSMVHRETFRVRPDDYAPNVRSRIESGMLVPAAAYVQAQRMRRRFRCDMDEALRGYDAVLTPATPTAAPGDLSTTGDPMFQTPWTVAGLPVLTLPTGLDSRGLPLAVQFVGGGFDDERLLAVAAWAERVLGADLGVPAGVVTAV